ncbi:hypothetical protein V7152_13220 [Neobacillus drentensis]|uniref:RipA family octameric membrane protein n=1 Tax=Neobacillus drentensis TaxID=220684 RepID=UPI002FFE98BA
MEKLTLERYKEEFKIEQNNNDTIVQNDEETAESKDGVAYELTREAHKQALDIRKFEIDMYWKRATYFWTIIGVIFAGFFLLMKDDTITKHPTLITLLSCIGFIFSLSWFMVNRGSKFWQNNWERHVDLLEDSVTGPLYKTVIHNKNIKLTSFHKEYNYSVSKINQLLSLYVTLIWFGMIFYVIFKQIDLNFIENATVKSWLLFIKNNSKVIKIIALVIGTGIAAITLGKLGKSDIVNQDTNKDLLSIRKRKIE